MNPFLDGNNMKQLSENSEKTSNIPQELNCKVFMMGTLYDSSKGLHIQPLNLQPLFKKSVEKWFYKSDSSNFFFLVNHFSRTKKKSEFADQLFSDLKKCGFIV